MHLHKFAEKERQFSANIKTAILQGQTDDLKKYAAGLSDLLMTYTYSQGHARRIFGGLNGEPFEKMNQDDPRVIWEPERERVKVRYYLQPEYKQVSEQATPVQSWAGPYMQRVSSYVYEGYFSKLLSEEIIKKVEEIAAYPFDIVEFFKDQTVKQILEREDRAFYSAMNNLILQTESETLAAGTAWGRSIYATYLNAFDNEDVINGLAKHIDSAKRSQPKEFMLLPEIAYIQFAKIDQSTIDGLSRRFWDEGFGDKAGTILYDTKAVRVDDASYATFEAGQSTDKSKFGAAYTDNAAGNLAMYQAAGYSLTVVGDLVTRYGIDTVATGVDSFLRIYILPPRNFLGKALLWGSDIKTNLKYENEYVTFYSSEWLTYLFHNMYAPTAIDLWYQK